MKEARLLPGRFGLPRDHCLVPFFDFLRRMLGAVLLHPFQDLIVAIQSIRCLFECVAVQLQKSEQMLVEADGFVVVSVEKSLAMEARFVDQAREMNVTAELLVWTTRMGFASRRQLKSQAEAGPPERVNSAPAP